NYATLLGLGEAVRLALALGLDAIGERTTALGAKLRGLLGDLPGVTTHDLGETRCAIVTAKVRDTPSEKVAEWLAEYNVNVTTTVAEHTPFDTEDRGVHPLVRLSPHYYNTEAELERAAALIGQ